MKKTLNILLLFDSPAFTSRGHDFTEEFRDEDWITERDAYKALRANGYKVRCLGIHDDISILAEEVKENRPDVIFNLTEVFDNESRFEMNIVALIEMLGIPCTGASSSALHICNDKALTKKILRCHKIKIPDFHIFRKGCRGPRIPKTLKFPLIVKPAADEASRGISRASVVNNRAALKKRVMYVHKKMGSDALVEEYIGGREFYVGVLGHKKIEAFPPIEIKFGHSLGSKARIATHRSKWDAKYRKRWGIKNILPGRFPGGIDKRMKDICKRAYRALDIRSYVRFDLRITPDGDIYILEANANPNLAKYEDFGLCAEKHGFSYPALIKKIVSLTFRSRRSQGRASRQS